MKKFFFMLLLIPILSISQTKNVINSFRVFPKPDKIAEFEKGMAAHAQKYHTGNWKWRVYEIQSGPDANGFHVIEGPLSWDDFDKRGNLGAEHQADWNKTVAPYITGEGTSSYNEFDADLSNVAMTDYADKIVINHMMPKPGMLPALNEMVKKMKKVWQASNESVAVYHTMYSGAPQIAQVTRLKGGLKELDDSYRKPLPERYNEVYGEGAWAHYLEDYARIVESRWSELLFVRNDLGSK